MKAPRKNLRVSFGWDQFLFVLRLKCRWYFVQRVFQMYASTQASWFAQEIFKVTLRANCEGRSQCERRGQRLDRAVV